MSFHEQIDEQPPDGSEVVIEPELTIPTNVLAILQPVVDLRAVLPSHRLRAHASAGCGVSCGGSP
mgnify:CR=1 FL=1